MVLSQYPNINPEKLGWEWIQITKVINGNSFIYKPANADINPLKWNGKNVWLHGYWQFDWADNYVLLNSVVSNDDGSYNITIDPNTKTVYSLTANARFRVVNSFSDLDAPGEYYINDDTKILYFYPNNMNFKTAFLSISTAPVIKIGGTTTSSSSSDLNYSMKRDLLSSSKQVLENDNNNFNFNSINNVHHPSSSTSSSSSSSSSNTVSFVLFEGFNVLYSRDTGIVIQNGDHVTIKDVITSNHGHMGLIASGTNIFLSQIVANGLGKKIIHFYCYLLSLLLFLNFPILKYY